MIEVDNTEDLLKAIQEADPGQTIVYQRKIKIGGATAGKSYLHKNLSKRDFDKMARKRDLEIEWREYKTIEEAEEDQ